MARIAGVDLPKNKRMEIALTYIYGIGHKTAQMICDHCGIDRGLKSDDVSEDQVAKIRKMLEGAIKVEGDLRREISLYIKRLTDLGAFRGLRHKKGLPVRGQRTRTNCRTRKGPRRTVANKKK